MTDDLLGKIFYYLCEPGPLPLRHTLFVSRRFYSAVVNNAHLWTTISFDPSFFHHFHQRPELGNKFLDQCLLRSGTFPLCLHIDFSGLGAHNPTFLLDLLETFGKPGRRGFLRSTSLVLFNCEAVIQEIVAVLPTSLPSLKRISLSFFRDPINGSEFPYCPGLESVEMLVHLQPYPPFWGTNFAYVTTLSFGNRTIWEDFDLLTLSLFPELRDLTLFTEHGTANPSGLMSEQPIHLSHLEILRTQGYIPPLLLTKLVTPALKGLHLKANAEHFTSLAALQDLSKPFCQYIHAPFPEAVSTTEPGWATYLSRFVKKCIRIKVLYISKWMEEECKKFMSGSGHVLCVQ
jgi:hypothetical protein